MNAAPDDMLEEAARRWAIRVRDPAFADWDGFTAWLEADPVHNAAYEAVLDDLDAADALFDVAPAAAPALVVHPVPQRDRARRWRAPAVAAGVALLAVGGGWLALDRDPEQEYAAQPGQRRAIALADGSRILLNGGTRLTMDPANPRAVTMTDGEALFEIRHDPRRPFVVTTADGTRLVDVGTTFNVVGDQGALTVEVAEGAVVYRAASEMRLDAGEMLQRVSADAEPRKRMVDPATVGAWRTGYLQFGDAALGEVADDLSRNLGVAVSVDDRISARRFSGTIMLDGGADAVMARIGPLIEVRIERQGTGWRMTPPDGARP
ncbi:FecR family protein [Sphingomonas sp. ac-8]|uniref:FecR family protein n=1 Tax=Sphingomonas sp. ac-8 TaxID=3242977 RepID=UPI003A7FDFA2